jgi:hypothetical protein
LKLQNHSDRSAKHIVSLLLTVGETVEDLFKSQEEGTFRYLLAAEISPRRFFKLNKIPTQSNTLHRLPNYTS